MSEKRASMSSVDLPQEGARIHLVTSAMIEQRRLALRARCRVTGWRLTELEAWRLADEIRWMQAIPTYSTCAALVSAMKRGEIRMFGAPISVRGAEKMRNK